jgi:hypothetical protein
MFGGRRGCRRFVWMRWCFTLKKLFSSWFLVLSSWLVNVLVVAGFRLQVAGPHRLTAYA